MTTTQARVLADWVAATGRNLTAVYVTHGHGDHHFGLSVILDRFPGARAVAAPAVVDHMRESVDPQAVASFWARLLPGQIPDRLVVAEPLKDGGFDLEGHDLVVVDLGHTDTDDTTCLYVPDIGLVVAGDAAYNDVHLYLAESDPGRRKAWIAAIDTIEALDPRAVISGHKRAGRADDPHTLEETRQYIRDFDRIEATTTTARDLYDQMLALYPTASTPACCGSRRRPLSHDQAHDNGFAPQRAGSLGHAQRHPFGLFVISTARRIHHSCCFGVFRGGMSPSDASDGVAEAFYRPRGNGRYEPTSATESPWDPKAQHGGPPAALLAQVIDQTVEGPLRMARISLDILGPIPRRRSRSRSLRSNQAGGYT